MRLNARAGVGLGPFTVVDLAMKFDLDRSTARNDSWTVEACTPLFQVARLKRTFLRRVVEDFGMSQGGLGAFPTDAPPALINYAGEHPDHVIDVLPPDETPPESADDGTQAPSVA